MVSSALNRLAPIDFTRYIDRLTERFTGREWLFEQIDRWLKQGDEQFYLLTGEPGVGKSAIAAKLTQIRSDITAYHFCRAGDVETVRPGRVLRSLAAQLGKTLPHYGEALAKTIDPIRLRIDVNINIESLSNSQVTGIYIENLKESDPRDELEILLRAPLAALPDLYAEHKEPLPTLKILLIDSLDEAVTTTGRDNMATLLAALSQADGLPSWIRFILTARPDLRVLQQFQSLKRYKLEELLAQNLEDIEQYVGDQVQELVVQPESEFQARLEQAELSAETLVREVKDLSKGNFLYTRLVMDGIGTGELSLKNLSILPKTLNEVYQRFLRHRCPFRKWSDRHQSILGTLTVTQEPISKEQLVKFTGIDSEKLEKALGILQQFLDEREDEQKQKGYIIFHRSLQEYLLDKKHNQDFWCDEQEQHTSIIKIYLSSTKSWDKVIWNNVDNYGLKYLTKHSYEQVNLAVIANQKHTEIENYRQNLYGLICQSMMWAKLARFGSNQSFAEDVDLSVKTACSENPPNLLQELRGYLIYSTLVTSATNIPVKILTAMVKADELTKSLGYVSLIQDKDKQSQAYQLIGEILLEQGKQRESREIFEKSLASTGFFENHFKDINSSIRAIEILTRLRDIEGLYQILQLGEALKSESDKAAVLSKLPQALVMLGDEAGLYRILAAASAALLEDKLGLHSTGEDIEDGSLETFMFPYSEVLSEVAKAFVQLGNFDQALITSQAIKVEKDRSEVLGCLAQLMLHKENRKKLDQLLIAIELIKEEEIKSFALGEVASVFAQVGASEITLENANVLLHILETAERMSNEVAKSVVLSKVAVGLAQVGESKQALGVVTKIKDGVWRANTLSKIVQVLTQASDLEGIHQVLKIALDFSEDYQYGFGYQTCNTLTAFKHEYLKTEILGKVAIGLAQLGDKEGVAQALAGAEAIREEAENTYILGDFPQALALVKDQEGLNRLIEAVDALQNDEWQAEALSKLTEALVLLKDKKALERVFTSAEKIGTSWTGVTGVSAALARSNSANILMKVALVLTRLDEADKATDAVERALAVAKTIEDIEKNARGMARDVAEIQVRVLCRLVHYLIQMKRFEQAIFTVETIKNEEARLSTLSSIAEALADVGDKLNLQRIFSLSEAIRKDEPKARALSSISVALAELGKFDEALLVAEAVQYEDWTKVRAITAIAHSIAQMRDKDKLQHLLYVIEKIEAPSSKADSLREVANALAKIGDKEGLRKALAVAESVSHDYQRINALNGVIQALGQVGDRDALYKVLTEEPNVEILNEIARSLAKVNDIKGLHQILEKFKNFKDDYLKAEALNSITPILLSIGDKQGLYQVLQAVKAIEGVYCKEYTVAVIALAGDIDQALTVVKKIEDKRSKDIALERTVQALVKVKKFDQILAIADLIEDEVSRDDTLQKIALALAKAGDYDQALVAIAAIGDTPGRKTGALRGIVHALLQVGNCELALALAEQIRGDFESDYWRGDVLSDVAQCLAKTENQDRAILIARQALDLATGEGNDLSKALALGKVALACGEAGSLDLLNQVLENVKAIEDGLFYQGNVISEHRASALSDIAKALIIAGYHERVLSIWEDEFSRSKLAGRQRLLIALDGAAPFIATIDQGRTLYDIYSMVMEVDSWWSWSKL